jgi:hypothetical protein
MPGEGRPVAGVFLPADLQPSMTAEEVDEALDGMEALVRWTGATACARAAFLSGPAADELFEFHKESLEAFGEFAERVVLSYEVAQGVPGAFEELTDEKRGLSPIARLFWREVDSSNRSQEAIAGALGWSESRVSRAKRHAGTMTRRDAVAAGRYFGNLQDPKVDKEKFFKDFMQTWENSQGYRVQRRTRLSQARPGGQEEPPR